MSVLSEAIGILGTPQGSLVYHLLLLWVVLSALGIVWGEWQRARREHAQRLLVAMSGLALVRFAYVLAAFLTWIGWVDQAILLPPLERFADAATLGLLAWAFVPPSSRGANLWNAILGGVLVLALGTCVGFTILWSQALAATPTLGYNTSWQATVWLLGQVALAVTALVAILRSRREGWGTFAPALFIVLLGALAQWYMPPRVPHLPLWQRAANLIAYPLFAVAIYQDVVAGLHVHSRELQDISQASLDQIKSLLYLFEASQQTSSSLDLTTVLNKAAQGIARVLNADQCAIAFPEEGNAGQMRLVAIHNPTRQGRGEAVSFPLEYQLTVQQAIRRKRHVLIEDSENVQLKVLFALLGSGGTGPLLVQPLVDDREVVGAIIVGNARSQRSFSANEAKLCQSMAEQVVSAIQNARRYQEAQVRIHKLSKAQGEEQEALQEARQRVQELAEHLTQAQHTVKDLERREEIAREARNALEIKLVSRRAEGESLAQRLAVIETDLAQTHANANAQIRWHEQELIRQQIEWEETLQDAEAIQHVLHGMTAGLLITDAQGQVEEVNVAAEILLDRGSEDLRGLALEAISDDERWQQAVSTARGGEAVRLTMRIGINTLMCDVAPLQAEETAYGQEQKLVAILQDISAETEDQRARLEAIALLSEELRTPITTVVSYADLLLSEAIGILGEAQRKFLLRIKAGAERMSQMVSDLTREAGGEEQWARPQRQEVDLNKLVEATVAGAHTQLEDRELTLDLDLPEDLPLIKADPDYMRRVVTNLLSNACLASSVGGEIQVRTAESTGALQGQRLHLNGDRFVVLAIRDSGGGLQDEALGRIFDRGRPSRTPPGLGESGAGLALVKTLVEAHGGRLWVESEQGAGTTFSFILPVNDLPEGTDLAGAG